MWLREAEIAEQRLQADNEELKVDAREKQRQTTQTMRVLRQQIQQYEG